MTTQRMRDLSTKYHQIQAKCGHATAHDDDHRCPSCNIILRRCCGSPLGAYHYEGCRWVARRLAVKRASAVVGESE